MKTAWHVLKPVIAGQGYALACWSTWLILKAFPALLDHERYGGVYSAGLGALIFLSMLGSVFAVVHRAEELAEQLGEPFGTLVLTFSAASIEVSLLLMVMLGGDQNPELLRDTVFATLMVVLNFLVGLALLAGGWRHVEQEYNLRGALGFLHVIVPLALLLLVLPNHTVTTSTPSLAPVQEAFLGVLCVSVYAIFLRLQMGRHRSHFRAVLVEGEIRVDRVTHEPQGRMAALRKGASLMFALLPIVLLAEHLATLIDYGIEQMHWPPALGGLMVTALVLTPEGMSAYRAAIRNRMQRAINICLGSSLSTMALTTPLMLIASAVMGHALILAVSPANTTLLIATLMVTLITFVSGRANMLQGTVHLMLFAGYLLFIFVP